MAEPATTWPARIQSNVERRTKGRHPFIEFTREDDSEGELNAQVFRAKRI